MRTLLTVVSLLLALPAGAAPATPESIEELLRLTKAEGVLDAMYANMDGLMRRALAESLKGQKLTPGQQRSIEAAPARFAGVMREEMSWAKVRPLYVQIYRESFTQEEVDALTAFYRTPAGAAFVDKMPVVMQKSIGALQSRMGPLLEKMKVAVDDALAEAGVKRQ
jgi:hypothetical protein